MDNDNQFTIVSVHSPLIQFSSSGSYYTSYAISLKSNNPCFTHSYSQIRRRYSEFLVLRQLLKSHYPTINPPILPPKNYFHRFSDSFIEERKNGLQTFLDKVLDISVYLSDKSLHLFLQSSASMNQISEECVGDIPAPQLMDFNSDLSCHSDTSSTQSSCPSDKIVTPLNDDILRSKPTEIKSSSIPKIERPFPSSDILTTIPTEIKNSNTPRIERPFPSSDMKQKIISAALNCNSQPRTIPRRNGSLDSSPTSSLSSLETSDCSSFDFNRRRVSFNQRVTVAVVYNHLWNIGTRPIRTDA